MKKILIWLLLLLLFPYTILAESVYKKDSTSKLIEIFVSDSSSTIGGGLTGLVYNSASLTAYYYCSGTTATVIDMVTNAPYTLGTWESGLFKEIDATNMPGWYQFGIPNAALASGCGDDVNIHLKGAANMVPLPFAISLVDNLESDTYAKVDTEVASILDDTGTSGVLISDGAGAGQINLTSGAVDTVTSITNAVTVGSINDNVITAASVATTATDEITDSVWDEVLTGATHNVASSAGKRLRQIASGVIHSGTLPDQTGIVGNAIKLDTLASATPHTYVEDLIVIDSGTGLGQSHHILSYDGTTKIAIIDDNWITPPIATDTFLIYGASTFDAVTGLATAGTSNSITLQGDASTTLDFFKNQEIYIASGTGAGQRRIISNYSTGRVATVSMNWAVTPDATSAYMLYGIAEASIIAEGVETAVSNSTTIKVYTALSNNTRRYLNMCLESSTGERSRITGYGSGFFNVRGFAVAPADGSALKIYSDGCL